MMVVSFKYDGDSRYKQKLSPKYWKVASIKQLSQMTNSYVYLTQTILINGTALIEKALIEKAVIQCNI